MRFLRPLAGWAAASCGVLLLACSPDKVDGKYLAMPHDLGAGVFHWRKSWFKEVGTEKFPATFDELFAVGKKLKDKGRPLGQAFGHSFGDPPGWCYAMLWAYGGQEVDGGTSRLGQVGREPVGPARRQPRGPGAGAFAWIGGCFADAPLRVALPHPAQVQRRHARPHLDTRLRQPRGNH